MILGVGFGELFEESLQAPCVHPRKIKAEALSRCGFEWPHRGRSTCRHASRCCCRVDETPWDPVAPLLVPVDESETSLVKGHNLQRFPAVTLAVSPDGAGEVFLKASCCFVGGRLSRGEDDPS